MYPYYKNGEQYQFSNPLNNEELQAFLSGDLTGELISIDTTPSIDYIARFYADEKFGTDIVNEFLKDNRLLPTSFTQAQNIALMQKFSTVKAFCDVANIDTAYNMLKVIVVDAIFTQERKDKYLNLMKQHLIDVHKKREEDL